MTRRMILALAAGTLCALLLLWAGPARRSPVAPFEAPPAALGKTVEPAREVARRYSEVAIASGGTRVALLSKLGIEVWKGDALERVLPWRRLESFEFSADGRFLVWEDTLEQCWAWDAQRDIVHKVTWGRLLGVHPEKPKVRVEQWKVTKSKVLEVDLEGGGERELTRRRHFGGFNLWAISPSGIVVAESREEYRFDEYSTLYADPDLSSRFTDDRSILVWSPRQAWRCDLWKHVMTALPASGLGLTRATGPGSTVFAERADHSHCLVDLVTGTVVSPYLTCAGSSPRSSVKGDAVAVLGPDGGCLTFTVPEMRPLGRIGGHGTELTGVPALRGSRMVVQTNRALLTWDLAAGSYHRSDLGAITAVGRSRPYDPHPALVLTSQFYYTGGGCIISQHVDADARGTRLVTFADDLRPQVVPLDFDAKHLQSIALTERVALLSSEARTRILDLENGSSRAASIPRFADVNRPLAVPGGFLFPGFNSTALGRPSDTGMTMLRLADGKTLELTIRDPGRKRHIPLVPVGYVPALDLVVTSCAELFDLKTQTSRGFLEDMENRSNRYLATPDGATIVGQGEEITLTDTRSRRLRATLHERDCEVEAFSPDSRLLVLRNRATDIVSLYDLRSAALVGRVAFYHNATDWVFISPDGRLEATEGALAAASVEIDGKVRKLSELGDVSVPGLFAQALSGR